MCMGVATANSILVVSFAREQLAEGKSAVDAALEAGATRFRPVLMTALAMIIGMAPMAIEAGRKFAARDAPSSAVSLFATFATLLFVPTVFSIVHRANPNKAKADAPPSRSPACPPTPDPELFPCPLNLPPLRPNPKRVASCSSSASWRSAPLGLAVSGIMDRARSKQEVAAWTNAQTVPTVRVVRPERGSAEQELVLPGNVAAFNTGSLFARASGYITAWNKDIGAHVTKGEVLATISAPDLDQQLEQAKGQLVQLQAAVQQAQANADLGNVTDQRTAQLVAQGWSEQAAGRHRPLERGRPRRRGVASPRPMSWRSRPRSAGSRS